MRWTVFVRAGALVVGVAAIVSATHGCIAREIGTVTGRHIGLLVGGQGALRGGRAEDSLVQEALGRRRRRRKCGHRGVAA